MNPTHECGCLGQVERRPRIVAALVCAILLVMTHCLALCLADTPKPNIHRITPRPPRDEADLQRWLENMVWHHGFSTAEVTAATGLAESEVEAALKRLKIRPEERPVQPARAPLLVLPYPGGRHPRIGAVE
ncbi:MAG: hypothetical protein K8T91_06400, partial [Planctomycetes bacterium]|nr:hypothetical protein [Planctomycetota bacterium]